MITCYAFNQKNCLPNPIRQFVTDRVGGLAYPLPKNCTISVKSAAYSSSDKNTGTVRKLM